jgi:hypothetical protein
VLDGEPGEILVYTDEAGPVMIPGAREELARILETGSAVLPRPVHAEPPRNVTVTSAVYGDGLEGGQVTFRVASFGPDAVEAPCEVELPDGAQIPVFVSVPPEGEAEARVTLPREVAGGVGEVRCDDPDLPSDDVRWFHVPPIGASRVLVVDGDPGDTPTRSEVYFLERALAPLGAVKTGVLPDVVSPKGVDVLDDDVHGVVFLANVPDPRPLGPRLRAFVQQGGTLVISLGDNVVADRYAAAFGALLPSPLRAPETLADRAEDPVPLDLPDTSLPLFEPFARRGRLAFGAIGSWRAFSLEPYADGDGVATLLRYRTGLPALVERRVGRGRVVVWTSTVDLAWSSLPLQTAFLPLVQRLGRRVDDGGGDVGVRLDATVGDRIVVAVPEGTGDVRLTDPAGAPGRLAREGSSVAFVPDRPGAWVVGAEGAPPVARVAVNVDAAESDVRRSHDLARVEADLDPERFLRHADLAPPLLGVALALLAASAALAARPAAPEEVA